MPDLTRKAMSPVINTSLARAWTLSTLGVRLPPICLRHFLHCAAHSAACVASWRGPIRSVHSFTGVLVVHFDLGAHSEADAAV